VGTPQYLSPEAISGAEPTPSVDIYAFGIALYELFTGNPPFHSDQLLQVLNQHMYQEPPWPTSIPPQILPLLQAMLAKNPQARPTAADIARSIEPLLAAATAQPTPTPQPAPQQPQRPAQSAQAAPAPGQPPQHSPVPGGTPLPPVPAQTPQPQAQPRQQPPYGAPGGAPLSPAPGAPLGPPPGQQPSPYPSVVPPPGQPAPYPQQPQPTPYPGAQGAAPLPAPYGRPQETPLPNSTPVPAPSPSGFFYPSAGMFDPNYANSSAGPGAGPGTDSPTGGAFFAPSPPPFTDAMLTPKKQPANRKKLLIAIGAVVGVAAVGGIVFALTGGSSPAPAPHPIAAGTTSATGSASASTGPTATVSPSCSPQSGLAPAASWPLNGTAAACTASAGSLHLFGGAAWATTSSRGSVLKLNGQTSRATMPLGSIVDTSHSFTVSAWVDLDSLPKSTKTVVAFQGKSLDAFELQFDPSADSWAFARSSVDGSNAQWVAATDSKTALTHAWTHLVGVYDSTSHNLTLYVNGANMAGRSGVSGWQATGKITVGASLDSTGNPYQNLSGEISQVQIYSSALTQAQVQSLK
jgi:hypothetical protein